MSAGSVPNLQQQNATARALIAANGVTMTQQIFSGTVNPVSNNVLNITPRNVGLLKGFILDITATITNASGAAVALTDFNVANLLSNITFTDLQNNVRISTAGWHLHFVDTVKSNNRVFGSSQPSDSPVKYGSNFNVISAPATIAASTSAQVTMKYWVPIAYSDSDLRGSIYLNVVNATALLSLTLNTANTIAAAGADSTLAIYAGNTGGTLSSATVTCYQVYVDQIPMGKMGPVIPIIDISTVYELKNTTFTGLVTGQEFPMQYSNFRDFVSTFMVYYNGTARTSGTDINYLSLQSANFTNIFKYTPSISALRTRQHVSTDFPPGVYYNDHRLKPIATTQYGNMQLIVNPSVASGSAYALVGYEDFALVNTVTQAGSLAAS